jgi:O-acetyl-ADP-ribose deacetylase (regulator of RNase III)
MSNAPTSRLRIVQSDITKLDTTAIVNPTNSLLLYLPKIGGTDSVVHRAAGSRVLAECYFLRKHRSPVILPMGQAVVTSGGDLPANYIIHTAGPTWHDGSIREKELLQECYRSCLKLAAQREFISVAFPGISTGIYGYPKAEAAAVAVREVRQWLAAHEWPREVVLVAFDEETEQLYEQEVARTL